MADMTRERLEGIFLVGQASSSDIADIRRFIAEDLVSVVRKLAQGIHDHGCNQNSFANGQWGEKCDCGLEDARRIIALWDGRKS